MKYSFLIFLFGIAASGWAQAPMLMTKSDSIRGYQLHFQQTVITQAHPDFHAAYTGPNSLQPGEEGATSLTATMFLTARLRPWLTAYFNPELAGGAGVSKALGVAGFMNGETFRVGNPTPQVYVARAYLQVSRPLGENGSYHIEAGKFSLADYFDQNNGSHDPRSQFFNWALMSNGAWDYPANVRGYTVSLLAGVQLGPWAVQAAVSQVPKTANSATLDANIGVNRGHTLEVSRRWKPGTDREANVRLLGFYNLASMGSYALAINPANLIEGKPDITSVRQSGRTKMGWGISADKKLPGGWILFGRAGYNDGKNETWAFTEIEQTVSLGVTRSGERWIRPKDVAGLAYAANGIDNDHRKYLAAGGTGFMLGDGALNYCPEMAFEFFYKIQAHEEHFFITPDYQFIINPGYNKDRGPVHVFALRVHTEF